MQPRAQFSDRAGRIPFRLFGTQPVRLATLSGRRAFWSTQISLFQRPVLTNLAITNKIHRSGGYPPRLLRSPPFPAMVPEAAKRGSGANGVQAVLALPVVADQRRLREQRELFGIVEREPQTICGVPDA